MQKMVFLEFLFNFIEYPEARKFHSIFPFRQNEIIMFGGGYFDQNTHRHSIVNGNLWKFDFEKLEWSMLPSLTMLKPSYFHAGALNEVKIIFILVISNHSFVFSKVKFGHMEVLYATQQQIILRHVSQHYIKCISKYLN